MNMIIAEMRKDWVDPYARERFGCIPIVIQSSHPRFVEGTRFDYGFLQVALREGYEVQIRQTSESLDRVKV